MVKYSKATVMQSGVLSRRCEESCSGAEARQCSAVLRKSGAALRFVVVQCCTVKLSAVNEMRSEGLSGSGVALRSVVRERRGVEM